MTTALIVPWATDCPHRTAIWAHLRERHEDLGRTIVTGTQPGPWCKARAVQDAIDRTDADVLVIHDADVWCDDLDRAVAEVEAGAPWAIPHRYVHRLTAEATAERMEAETETGGSATPGKRDEARHLEQRPYLGYAGGGITVTTRATWERVPMDPRFVGWGHEDSAWAIALRKLIGPPWRGRAPLLHFWHPPQPRLSRRLGSRENLDLEKLYRRAQGRALEQLVDQARTELRGVTAWT